MPGGILNKRRNFGAFERLLAVDPAILVFCRPDQCSLTNFYVDNNSSLISELLASFIFTR
jgi:hypothetical protein